jgi:hypothetical protein
LVAVLWPDIDATVLHGLVLRSRASFSISTLAARPADEREAFAYGSGRQEEAIRSLLSRWPQGAVE